jgi:hypothetical protein
VQDTILKKKTTSNALPQRLNWPPSIPISTQFLADFYDELAEIDPFKKNRHHQFHQTSALFSDIRQFLEPAQREARKLMK